MIKRPRMMLRLTGAMFAEVVSFLPIEDVLVCGLVCRTWSNESEHWKLRGCLSREVFLTMRRFLHSFRGGNRRIESVLHTDHVWYMNAQFDENVGAMFIDVCVGTLTDSISLCVVDFDGIGGCSSLTFSPDTGTVIMEHKSTEGEITGEYFQCLNSCEAYTRCGVYISQTSISFYRKQCNTSYWETTGEVSDCKWVVGGIITPCIAFRDSGIYDIRINRVTSTPPCNVIEAPHTGDWKTIGLLYDEDTESTITSV